MFFLFARCPVPARIRPQFAIKVALRHLQSTPQNNELRLEDATTDFTDYADFGNRGGEDFFATDSHGFLDNNMMYVRT